MCVPRLLDTTKMKVDEIRNWLIDQGLDEELVNKTKGKGALVKMVDEVSGEPEDDDTLSIDEVDFGDEESTGDFEITDETQARYEETGDTPVIGDPGWSDYVMAQFIPEELIKGNPTVDGMRRVVEFLISPIVGIDTQVLQTPCPENEGRATVVVTVRLDNNMSCFSGAADVCYKNATAPFCNFPVSLAETKAEGRALKRVLRLRKVLSAEELVDGIEGEDNSPINDTQLQFFSVMCGKDRLNINVKKLVALMEFGDSPKGLTYHKALKVNEKLTKYQNKEEEVPADLVGYDPNWRD